MILYTSIALNDDDVLVILSANEVVFIFSDFVLLLALLLLSILAIIQDPLFLSLHQTLSAVLKSHDDNNKSRVVHHYGNMKCSVTLDSIVSALS